ncbi:MAG: type II toxin-antitoxin system RelB/DinJ family antitoxin [Bifidobacteriaceae bacterium]|jgi:DNA-damage-inducible protein J|nr:type II toxin-antitoxin system RelB/DinJ family antitoxin [Bifidobacteriaceae bacterium]
MDSVQLATRISKNEDRLFRETTRELGTTPADAMRVFVAAFNRHRGFPFDVRLTDSVLPFRSEEEALDFVDRQAGELLNDAW